jgi:hypothetical protein
MLIRPFVPFEFNSWGRLGLFAGTVLRGNGYDHQVTEQKNASLWRRYPRGNQKQNEKAITDLTSSDQRGLPIGHYPEYRSRQKKAE